MRFNDILHDLITLLPFSLTMMSFSTTFITVVYFLSIHMNSVAHHPFFSVEAGKPGRQEGGREGGRERRRERGREVECPVF